jgi:hypothetical protein
LHRFLPLAALVVLAAPPAGGAGLDAPARLERARVCRAALDFACAEEELAAARAGLGDLPPEVRVEVLVLSAETALSTGRRADAEAHLRGLLDLRPDWVPAAGSWPSGWVAALERVRDSLPDRLPPSLDANLPGDACAGRSAVVGVRARDRSGMGPVVLVLPGPPPVRIPMTTSDGETWTATVPAERVAEPGVPFWIEAFDLAGNGPATWGGPDRPRTLPVGPVPARPSRPLVRQWWFWTAIGAVAAGAAVGVYYLARPRAGSSVGVPGPGRIDVEVRWPAL